MELHLNYDNGVSTIETEILMPEGTFFAHKYGIYKVISADPKDYQARIRHTHRYSKLFYKLSNETDYYTTINSEGNIEISKFDDCVYVIIQSVLINRFNVNVFGEKIIVS